MRSAAETKLPNKNLPTIETVEEEVKGKSKTERKLPLIERKKIEKPKEDDSNENLSDGTIRPLYVDPEELINKEVHLVGLPKGIVKERVDEEQYRVEYKNGKNQLYTYQELIEILNKADEDGEERWTFDEVGGHRYSKNKKRKGKIDVLIRWDTGEESWEPMEWIKKDDPVTLAKYARDKGLLDKGPWKWAKRYAKDDKKLNRMLRNMNASKKKARKVKFKFGVRIPRNYEEAMMFDKINGNTKWADACKTEIECLLITYECFKLLQKGEAIPKGYTKVPLIWAFDVKFDGRHRGRLVAGGHMTWVDPEEGYSSTVSLDDVCLAFVAAMLMKLGVIAADVTHAYIRALCKEKRFAIAGPEFRDTGLGNLEGQVLIIVKALYGLRTSGAAWHAEAADTLRAMGLT